MTVTMPFPSSDSLQPVFFARQDDQDLDFDGQLEDFDDFRRKPPGHRPFVIILAILLLVGVGYVVMNPDMLSSIINMVSAPANRILQRQTEAPVPQQKSTSPAPLKTSPIPISTYAQPIDPRWLKAGSQIYESGYVDQPYVVRFDDGTWLVTFTTATSREGAPGQHIVAATSTDKGKTWSRFVEIEPPTGPVASWAMPYLTSFGRVYVFYNYNGDHITELNGHPIRNDMLGWYCFKYSDDMGKTWSRRYRLPVRVTAVDRHNDWQGQVQIMWGVGKPIDVGNGMMFGFTKLGRYMQDLGEGWFFYSKNINAEREVEKLRWEMLPRGDRGVRNPAFGSIQEEHNLVRLNNGSLYAVYRTRMGYMANSVSADGGVTWSLPKIVRYADGRPIKNPRANPRIWKTNRGTYLLWHHNHSGDSFWDRNPAWLSGGVEKNGVILWSQPEIVLYDDDTTRESGRFSYPDFIEEDGKYWLTATNKVRGQVHEIDPMLLQGLWGQFKNTESSTEGLFFNLDESKPTGSKVDVQLPTRFSADDKKGFFDSRSERGGLTIDFSVRLNESKPGQILIDSRNSHGNGILVRTTGYRQIELVISNGEHTSSWSTDPGLLDVVNQHHITAIIDNGPNIIMWVVNGLLHDGAKSRQYGWGRYDKSLGKIYGSPRLKIALRKLRSLKLYNRALRVSEAIASQSAASGASSRAPYTP